MKESKKSLKNVSTRNQSDSMQRLQKSMKMMWTDCFSRFCPQDLVKFGLIPEIVGRVPVTVALEMLDKDALMKILTEPKNALTKQYQKLLELDDVELTFDDKALEAIAETSLKRKTGARGLRAIMESIMMDIMYKAPSDETLKSCHITEDVVKGTGEPVCEHAEPDSESA